MRYNQEACSRRNAEGHESFLIFRMIRIAAGGCQWIIENAHRLVKRNSMLAKVPGSLGGVPFEAHASLLSRGNLSRSQSHHTINKRLSSLESSPTRVTHHGLRVTNFARPFGSALSKIRCKSFVCGEGHVASLPHADFHFHGWVAGPCTLRAGSEAPSEKADPSSAKALS